MLMLSRQLGLTRVQFRQIFRAEIGGAVNTALGTYIAIAVAERARQDFPPEKADKIESYFADLRIDQNKIK